MNRRFKFIYLQVGSMLGILVVMTAVKELILWEWIVASEIAFLLNTAVIFRRTHAVPRNLYYIHAGTLVISLLALSTPIIQRLGLL